MCRLSFLRDFDAKAESIVDDPARCRNFDHARIIERILCGIEIRVGPDGPEFRRADRIGPVGVLHVHGVTHRGQFAVSSGLAAGRPCHVVDFFVSLALIIEPAFDDLDAIKVGSNWIPKCVSHEGR